MKIKPSSIFTILGNAADNINEGFITEDKTIYIRLDNKIVGNCLETSDTIPDDYTIWAKFCRQGLVDITLELYDEETEDNKVIDSLIDRDDLPDFLEDYDKDCIHKTMCSLIYATA